MLLKNDQGVPYSKVWKGHHVMPANQTAAKKLIESREFAMKDNPYTKEKEVKPTNLYGDFRKSYVFDNTFGSDNTLGTRALTEAQTTSRIPRMHYTKDLYQVEANQFRTFLNEREELPRLSILDNYK